MKHIEFEFNWKLQIVKINDARILLSETTQHILHISSVLENGTLRPPVNVAEGKSTYQSSVYSRSVRVGSATSSLAVGEGKASPINIDFINVTGKSGKYFYINFKCK